MHECSISHDEDNTVVTASFVSYIDTAVNHQLSHYHNVFIIIGL